MTTEPQNEVTDFTKEQNVQTFSREMQNAAPDAPAAAPDAPAAASAPPAAAPDTAVDVGESAELAEWLVAVKKYKNAQGSLLSVALLTLVNIALVAFGASLYFPFSATCPFLLAAVMKANEVALILFLIPLLMAATYLLFRVLSNRSYKWMYVAFGFLVIDSLVCVWWSCVSGFADNIIDLLFHVWIMWSLCSGVKYGKRAFYGPQQGAQTFS